MKTKVIGTNATATPASKVEPQPSFNFSKIAGPANGTKAPKMDLSNTLAATADAEWMPKDSMRYVWMGICEITHYCRV